MYAIGNIIVCGWDLLPSAHVIDTIRNSEQFGLLIRERRRAAGLTQDDLAARCGVARRFIIDLEAGKPTCQIGKAITAAVEVGIKLGDTSTVSHEQSYAGQVDETPEDEDLSFIPKFP